MRTGCPWACCFFPHDVASKANLAIAASAIECCLAIVAKCLHLPNNIVKAVSVLGRIPIGSLPVHLVLKDAKRRLDHFEIIDILNSTNKAQEARLLCKSSIVPGPSWQIGCQVSRWGTCKQQLQKILVIGVCQNTTGPAIWQRHGSLTCGLLENDSTQGKWSHDASHEAKRRRDDVNKLSSQCYDIN